MHLVAAREQVVRRLVDADVRFDAADDNLSRARAFELRDEVLRAAGAKRRLLDVFEIVGQNGANLARRLSQSLRILLGDDDGHFQQLHGVRDEGDTRRRVREVRDRPAKRFLHVYDDERGLPVVERVFVLHVCLFLSVNI